MTNDRSYLGKPDQMTLADGWIRLDIWHDQNESIDWHIFIKSQDNNNDWVNIKVVADGRVKYKANYWFAFNLNNGGLGFARDLYLLTQSNRKTLHDYLMNEVLKNLKEQHANH